MEFLLRSMCMRFPEEYNVKAVSPYLPSTASWRPPGSSTLLGSLFMVGDSLMRYQYLSLGYWLHHNAFMPPEAFSTIHSIAGFNFENRGYASFFNFTNMYLGGPPHEYCDCHRDYYWLNVYENRYYSDAARNISINYIQFIGDKLPLRGQWLPAHPTLSNDSLRAIIDDNTVLSPLVKWNYTLEEYLLAIVPRFPSHATGRTLVLNQNLWLNQFHRPEYADSIITAAQKSFTRVIWKTTNCRRSEQASQGLYRKERQIDEYMCLHLECFDIEWTCHLHPDDHVDEGHFHYWVYNKINEQFMNHIARKPLSQNLRRRIIRVNTTETWRGVPYNGSLAVGATVLFFADDSGNLRLFKPATDAHGRNIANSCFNCMNHRGVLDWTVEQLSEAIISGSQINDDCREGALVRGNGKTVYIFENSTLRAFSSLAPFVARGLDFGDVQLMALWLLEHVMRGPDL